MACGPKASNEMREIEETRLLILGSVQYYPFLYLKCDMVCSRNNISKTRL